MESPLIPKINELDEVVGETTIAEAKENGWPRRIARVFVFNTDYTKMLLQLRSDQMVTYPGFWDQAVGGHVDVDESYEVAAIREMAEEIGVVDTPVAAVETSFRNGNLFEGIFVATIDDTLDLNFDRHEVADLQWLSIEDFERDAADHPGKYVPAFMHTWKHFKAQLLNPEIR